MGDEREQVAELQLGRPAFQKRVLWLYDKLIEKNSAGLSLETCDDGKQPTTFMFSKRIINYVGSFTYERN